MPVFRQQIDSPAVACLPGDNANADESEIPRRSSQNACNTVKPAELGDLFSLMAIFVADDVRRNLQIWAGPRFIRHNYATSPRC